MMDLGMAQVFEEEPTILAGNVNFVVINSSTQFSVYGSSCVLAGQQAQVGPPSFSAAATDGFSRYEAERGCLHQGKCCWIRAG